MHVEDREDGGDNQHPHDSGDDQARVARLANRLCTRAAEQDERADDDANANHPDGGEQDQTSESRGDEHGLTVPPPPALAGRCRQPSGLSSQRVRHELLLGK